MSKIALISFTATLLLSWSITALATTYSIKCIYTTSVAANIPHGAPEIQTDIKTNDDF